MEKWWENKSLQFIESYEYKYESLPWDLNNMKFYSSFAGGKVIFTFPNFTNSIGIHWRFFYLIFYLILIRFWNDFKRKFQVYDREDLSHRKMFVNQNLQRCWWQRYVGDLMMVTILMVSISVTNIDVALYLADIWFKRHWNGYIDVGFRCWRRRTNVGEEIYGWQFKDVGDGFGQFDHQYPLFLNISVGQKHPKNVIKILILSPIF